MGNDQSGEIQGKTSENDTESSEGCLNVLLQPTNYCEKIGRGKEDP